MTRSVLPVPVPRSSFVMPVSDAFDHDAKVSGDSARFADLPGCRRAGHGAEGGPSWVSVAGHESESRTLRCGAGHAGVRARERPGPLEQPECGAFGGRWLFAIADGLGDGAGHGDHADRDAVLRRPRRACSPGDSRVPARAASSTRAPGPHALQLVATSAAAPVLARHLDGRPDRSADMGLRDLQVGDRYLLCPDDLSPVVDDRPHRNVLTLRDLSADASASQPPYPGAGRAGPGGLVPMSKGPACGTNRLPAPAHRRG